ncbi:CidA/LrgA family protein [Rhizobium skierniewicense]|uniref:CidA/LrgA family protein n=1 Tax=Rhizobium skierniewicense TaxID=984260 RepID=UPI0015717771|nr:CidA/LrgA family protein [Rhizobium skierniewicense]NTF33922.1 CidA/LrgA family protein [Rhizobium skierniewicense]
MLTGITTILLFQLIGEIIAYFSGNVVPGPVIGMTLIAVFLKGLTARNWLPDLENNAVNASKALLANLGILFVPAGVGIIQHLDLLANRGIALLMIVFISTVLTLLVTVFVFISVKRLTGGERHD